MSAALAASQARCNGSKPTELKLFHEVSLGTQTISLSPHATSSMKGCWWGWENGRDRKWRVVTWLYSRCCFEGMEGFCADWLCVCVCMHTCMCIRTINEQKKGKWQELRLLQMCGKFMTYQSFYIYVSKPGCTATHEGPWRGGQHITTISIGRMLDAMLQICRRIPCYRLLEVSSFIPVWAQALKWQMLSW